MKLKVKATSGEEVEIEIAADASVASLKDAVRAAAAREHRSVANMVEVLIRRHCDQSGITVYEKPDLSSRRRNG